MHGQFKQNLIPYLPDNPYHDVVPVKKGLWCARLAQTSADCRKALDLRAREFRDGGADEDALDRLCRHALVEPIEGGPPVATFRFLHLADGNGIPLTYSAQYYDLSRMKSYTNPMLEIGRFCIRDVVLDPDILRLGWALLTRYVDAFGIGIMFGCSSFKGNKIAVYKDALALLKEHHLAPDIWRPEIKASEVVPFARLLRDYRPTLREANRQMPSLLRTYVTMGGWVSDHAVVDRDIGTFHVFTGVEIATIPEMRKRLLRADAA
ncbi:MAG: GNAT family N-acetyltransferase [Rhodobacteraceae bacterium]|nr:GNAT family N-acetyltransferase [Paracoccaceae bacterium]